MKGLVLLFLFVSPILYSQTKVYTGERANRNDIAYTITNQKVERMTASLWGHDVMFFKGNKVYGDSFRSVCLYTIKDNKVYRGDSDSVFDLLYEMDNNQFFLATSGSLRKCVFTYSNGQIFVGDSRSTFDCVFSAELDEDVRNSILLVFLCLAPY